MVLGQTSKPTSNVAHDSQRLISAALSVALLLTRSADFRKFLHDLADILAAVVNDLSETADVGKSSEDSSSPQSVFERDKLYGETQDVCTDDTQEQFLYNLQASMALIASRQDFQRGVRDGMDAVSELALRVSHSESDDPSMKELCNHLDRAHNEAGCLLQQFSQGDSFELVVAYLKQVVDNVCSDASVRQYVNDLQAFILRSLQEPQPVETSQWRDEARMRLQQGLPWLASGGQAVNLLLTECAAWLHNLSGTFASQLTTDSTTGLVCRIFHEQNVRGQPGTVALTQVLAPLMREMFKCIYIRLLEVDNEVTSYVIEHVLVQGHEVPQPKIFVESNNTQNQNVIHISVTSIRAHLHDVFMAYRRHVFPKTSDLIRFDAEICGDGLAMEILLAPSRDPNHIVDVTSVVVSVHDLTLQRIHGVEHDNVLYTLLKPVLQAAVRRNLEKAICFAVSEKLDELDSLLVDHKHQIVFA